MDVVKYGLIATNMVKYGFSGKDEYGCSTIFNGHQCITFQVKHFSMLDITSFLPLMQNALEAVDFHMD